MPGENVEALRLSVIFSPRAGEIDECALELSPNASVADALEASGLRARHPDIDFSGLAVGIWGAAAALGSRLRDGDRIEFCRPLQVDPKEARRRRQAMQRSTPTAAGNKAKRLGL